MAGSQSLTPIRFKDPSPYLVHASDEIIHTISRLAKKPEIIGLYADQQREVFILSAILAFNEQHIIFDVGPQEAINQRLLDAKSICCVAQLSSVHFQFTLDGARSILHDNRPAFECNFPNEMLRLQRRDFYRLSIPLSTPLSCLIPIKNGGDAEISISDISLGGIGLLGYYPDLDLSIGSILHRCRIELPHIGVITSDIEICTSSAILLKNGIRTLRSGCRFMHLSGLSETLIQRYINHVERKRLALE